MGSDQHENQGLEPAQALKQKIQPFRSFRNPTYRIFYFSLINQMAAMNMQMMARILLIYRLTESPTILGAISFAHAIPMLLLSLFGGVIADRFQKKQIILIGNLISVFVSLVVGLTLSLGYLSAEIPGSWWILVVASIFQGIIMALSMPARQAIIPEIVGGEQIMNATSLNTMGMNIMRLFAPAVAGFLIDGISFAAVYYTMTGLYALAAFFISFIPETGKMKEKHDGAVADVTAALQYVRKNPIILTILGFALVGVVLAMPYRQLLPIFTEDILEVGAAGMGIMMSVSGAGAIVGSVVIASLPNRKRGLMLLASGVFLGIVLTAFSFSSSWQASLALIALVGLGQAAAMTLNSTLIQYYVDSEFRGRVMSILMMEFGLMSFGTFAAGLLTEAIGVQWALGLFGMILTFFAVAILILFPSMRKLQ